MMMIIVQGPSVKVYAHPESQNKILFGNWVFVDVIKLSWGHRDQTPSMVSLQEEENLDKYTEKRMPGENGDTEGGIMWRQAEIAVMHP